MYKQLPESAIKSLEEVEASFLSSTACTTVFHPVSLRFLTKSSHGISIKDMDWCVGTFDFSLDFVFCFLVLDKPFGLTLSAPLRPSSPTTFRPDRV